MCPVFLTLAPLNVPVSKNLYFFDESRIKDSLVSAKFPVENIRYANTPERALI